MRASSRLAESSKTLPKHPYFLAKYFASFPGLVSGNDYDVVVSGELNSGFLSGSYSGNISIAPIPEPKAYAMLVAGLGLVAFAAFRRRHNYY